MTASRAAVVAAITVALTCVCVPAHAAPRWDVMYEGSAIPGPWYFSEITPDAWYDSEVDPLTLNRIGKLIDGDTTKNGRLQRQQFNYGWNGMTLHARFRVVSAADNSVRLQLSEDLVNGDAAGYTRWHWFNSNGGEFILQRGALVTGSNRFAAPLNQWLELWMKIVNPNWEIYLWNGSSWMLTAAGTLEVGGGVSCLGSGTTGEVHVDFLRHHTHGGYEPTDPNRPVLPNPTDRIGQAKIDYGIGYPVDLPDKIVTNSYVAWSDPYYYNHFFIQESDRSAGLRVRRVAASESDRTPVGSRVRVEGYFDIFSEDVAAIADRLTISTPAPDPVVLPVSLGMTTPRVGGSAFGVQPAASTLSLGLNNVGLRVRTCGLNTTPYYPYPDPLTGFWMSYVDDCDGVYNDTDFWFGSKLPGIKVYTAEPLTIGTWVEVTGNAAVEQHPVNGAVHYQVIYANQPGDVRTY